MTSGTEARRGAVKGPRPESKLRSYTRLAKLDVYDYYLSILVVLSAVLLPLAAFDSRVLPTLVVFLAGEILVTAAMVALDDVTGYHDGSDAANYGPDTPTRRLLRKPLIAGTLTPAEALRFAWLAVAAGGALWVLAVLLSPNRPLWTLVLIVVTFVLMPQYSYGIKLSYRGFQELFLVALGVALVLAPYGLVAGQFSGFVLVQALIFGMGPLLFGVYSNTNDIAGDRAVGRPTVAVLASPKGNARFVFALSVAEFAFGALGSLTGLAPWWFVLVMLPATAMRAMQYRMGFPGGDIMSARKLGFRVHRLNAALLIVANLIQAGA
ncbi:UbiA family prenyltransferase [Amycolatopsis nigrescens]|uniref:UbiA family prenyltransferase n=1 Tax=Amycolatopsis nigrescens TaxID=381445 RepID=UPI00036B5D47|nr:UbiA family prenyltransferase [Amycolatopsis nigrescens]